MPKHISVAELIIKARRFRDLSNNQLAAKLDVSVSQVRSWEDGVNRPGYKSLAELVRVLRIRPDYFFGICTLQQARMEPSE